MRKIVLIAMLVFLGGIARLQAQIPVVTIQDVQMVDPMDLAACNDSANFFGDTVTVYGTVVMEGGIANSAGGRQLWIQNGTGPFSGIDIRYSGGGATSPDDMLDLQAGDSVKITGVVERFSGETQLNPLENGVEVVNSARPVFRNPISVGDLNDNMRVNNLSTGEQWEGSYVTIYNVTVSSVDYFSSNTRVSFNVQDANGNVMNISDRFDSQRLSNGFVPPTVNTVYDSISGVIAHSENGCTNQNGRGYEMFPFQASDLVVRAGTSGPLISAINRNPVAPTSSQDVTVFANIEDADGTIQSAELLFAVGIGNNSYNTVAMTNTSGNTYEGTIPNTAFSDGDFVKYYITARDNDGFSSTRPNVPSGNFDPLFFAVRDNGLGIYDLQFTPFADGNSGYLDLTVTVTGIVTASPEVDNLGATAFIQQANTNQLWSGIQLLPGATAFTGLVVGDSVTITGSVQENFGQTGLTVDMLDNHGQANNPITPRAVDPDLFSSYDFTVNEAYESMLLTLENPNSGSKIYVVEQNADGPNSNFAEYRVGADVFDPASGSRVIAGRQTGNSPTSLNFSYVNDSSWITNSGMMRVPACVVNYQDSMESISGIMFYSFGNMKLLPRTNDDMVGFRGANCSVGVSVEDELAGQNLLVYPNPTSGQLFVDYRFSSVVSAQLDLYDLMGRRVLSQSIRGLEGTELLATQQLKSGTYLLSLSVEGQVIDRKKVVVTK
jgi:DNA/RNA endonuclease YhcR with UshA esterase domain